MKRVWLIWMLLCLARAGAAEGSPLAFDEAPEFAFEGTLDRMDARFAPVLREGLVFSGTYAYLDSAEGEDTDKSPHRATYLQVVGGAEVMFDRNHVWVYDAYAGLGDGRLDLVREAESGDRIFDLYAVTLPLRGAAIGEERWTPHWLQLWFFGEENEMLPSLALQGPPETFVRGWWRLTFWNEAGSESATVEGRLTAAGEAGAELTPSEQIAALEGVVVGLSERLEEAVARAGSLDAELESARKRISGLQSTIDLLVAERENLRLELTILEQSQSATPEALQHQITAYEADAILWEERELALTDQNRALAEALAAAEVEAARLRRTMERQEEALAVPEPSKPVQMPSVGPGEVLVVPVPQSVEEASRPLEVVASPPVSRVTEITVEVEEKASRSRRAGKFRRGR